jgi:hypothetical protein
MLKKHRGDSGDKPDDDTNIDEYASKRVYDLYDLVRPRHRELRFSQRSLGQKAEQNGDRQATF